MSVSSPVKPRPSSAGLYPEPVSRAKWIWSDDNPDEQNVWVYARRKIDVDNPARARLHITADLRYVVWINGRMIGFGPPKYHLPTPTLDTYEIPAHLHPGPNAIVVLVYSLGNVTDISSCMPRRGGLLVSVEVDGRTVVSDERWRVRRESAYLRHAVRRGEFQPHNEVFDDRRSIGEPWSPDFDDGGWSSAVEISDGPLLEPWERIEPRDIPLIPWSTHRLDRITETGIARYGAPLMEGPVDGVDQQIATAVREPAPRTRVSADLHTGVVTLDASELSPAEGCYVRWDLGRVETGYPVLEAVGEPGTVIDLSYAEHLSGGQIDPSKHGLRYFDRVILGSRPCQHRIMWPKCFRYVQADVRRGVARIDSLKLEISRYPVEWRGSFHCSDPVLDHAWAISAHTLSLCMDDNYMDTPWRERGSWLGDVVPQAHANQYAFGDSALICRFLRQHAKGQLPTGAMQGKYPGRCSSHISTWTLTFAITLWMHQRHFADDELVRELWPAVWQTVRWLQTYRTPTGLYGNFPLEVTRDTNVYTFIDWAPVDTSGCNAALNAFAYAFFTACEALASVAGDRDAQTFCRQRCAEIKDAFNRLLWDDARGVFVNGIVDETPLQRWGCHENYLAILFGLADAERQQAILKRLQDEDPQSVFIPNRADYDDEYASISIALNRYRWDAERMVPLGTPYFAYWALQARAELGTVLTALHFIRLHWGNYAKQGASTVWEQWSGEGSHSHAWGAAPIPLLGKYILGVAPGSEANVIEIFPQRADLTWASGRVPFPQGDVSVGWIWDQNWSVKLVVPDGCRAVAGLPAADVAAIVVDGETSETPRTVHRYGQLYYCVDLAPGRHHLQGRSQ